MRYFSSNSTASVATMTSFVAHIPREDAEWYKHIQMNEDGHDFRGVAVHDSLFK